MLLLCEPLIGFEQHRRKLPRAAIFRRSCVCIARLISHWTLTVAFLAARGAGGTHFRRAEPRANRCYQQSRQRQNSDRYPPCVRPF